MIITSNRMIINLVPGRQTLKLGADKYDTGKMGLQIKSVLICIIKLDHSDYIADQSWLNLHFAKK